MPSAFDHWLADLERAPRRAPLSEWKRRLAVCGDVTPVDRPRWLHALLRHGLGGDGKAPERLAFLDRCGLLPQAWGLELPHALADQRSLLGQLIQDRRPGPGQVDRWHPWIERGWAACGAIYQAQPTVALSHWRSLVRQSKHEEVLARTFVQRFPHVFNRAHPAERGLDHWTRGLPSHRKTGAWAWILALGGDPFEISAGLPHWEHAARAGLQEASRWARAEVPEAWRAYRDQRFCERLCTPRAYGISAEMGLIHQEDLWSSRPDAPTVRDRQGRLAVWHALRHCPEFPFSTAFAGACRQASPAEMRDLSRALVAGWLEQQGSSPKDLRPALACLGPHPFEAPTGVFLLTSKPNLAAQSQWAAWNTPAAFWWGGTDAQWQGWLQHCLTLPANQQQAWVQILTQGPYAPQEVHPFLRGLVVALSPQAVAWHLDAAWPVEVAWPSEWPAETQAQLRALQRRQGLREQPSPAPVRSRRRV